MTRAVVCENLFEIKLFSHFSATRPFVGFVTWKFWQGIFLISLQICPAFYNYCIVCCLAVHKLFQSSCVSVCSLVWNQNAPQFPCCGSYPTRIYWSTMQAKEEGRDGLGLSEAKSNNTGEGVPCAISPEKEMEVRAQKENMGSCCCSCFLPEVVVSLYPVAELALLPRNKSDVPKRSSLQYIQVHCSKSTSFCVPKPNCF